MAFGFFRRKPPARDPDPLAAYDQLLEDLERQAAEVRRSAATLLALKAELARGLEGYRQQREELDRRGQVAEQRRDARAETTLLRDAQHLRAQIAASEEALARAEADAALLIETAEGLAREISQLRAERTQARAQIAAGARVTDALRERSDRVLKKLALEAARDEVERAHALAQIYREDRGK